MKKIFIAAILLLAFAWHSSLFAQIGGLSGSKLDALCAGVVPGKKIEFEPGFYHLRASKYWDENGSLKNLYSTDDSIRKITGMNFRFSYGVFEKLELGTAISTDLSVSSWGAKFVVFQNQKIGVSVMAGANIPFGNREINKKARLSQLLTSVGGGAIFSANLTENLSFDFNGQYMFFTKRPDDNNKGSWYFNADFGYYVFKHQLQLITGIMYQDAVFKGNYTSQIFTIFPGITLETGKHFIIVLSAPFDVYGVNALKNSGITFALTILID